MPTKLHTKYKGIIAWFASNSVAANLLMISIVVGGCTSSFTIDKAIHPDFETNIVQVSVAYLGAAPAEIEQAVVLRIEEALQNINGIKKITSTAREGFAQVQLEVENNFDLNELLDQVKIRVDAISTFPEETEKPIVEEVKFPKDVLWISIYGDMNGKALKSLSHEVRDELIALPEVSVVKVLGDRDYEIAIEVSENTLRKYGLTLNEVAAAIRRSSIDMPGGTIKTAKGDILLKTKGQAYTGLEYAKLVLRTNLDGTRLLLGDIASIKDGFIERENFSRFNGKRALPLRVQYTSEQDVLDIDAAVQRYISEKKKRLPEGVQLDQWGNSVFYLNERLNMMYNNMMAGAVLVFLLLALFLRMGVALWVIVGIPIGFLGALWLMPTWPFPQDINILSLFGFILVLGIVVDDAIIIGESIYSEVMIKGHTLDNVIAGTKRVAIPATFGVLTTIAAFAPMVMVGGQAAPFFEAIAVVVILCLSFSLIESKLILPAHLVHTKIESYDQRTHNLLCKFQHFSTDRLDNFIVNIYKPLLEKAIYNRYTTVSLFIGGLIISIGIVYGGLLKYEFFPNVPNDFIQVHLSMTEGTADVTRNEVLDTLEQAIISVDEDYQRETQGDSIITAVVVFTTSNAGGIILLELTKPEEREIDAFEIEKRWREEVGEIAGVKKLRFFASTNLGGGAKINLQLSGTNFEELKLATEELKQKLSEYDGVFDIYDSYSRGSQEIQLKIKPEAEVLGLTLVNLGRQVRQAFYGEEAQRIQRGRDELKVMVRYPAEERRSVTDLENMRIRTPQGDEVPFSEVAEVKNGTSYRVIKRVGRKRAISIIADVDAEKVATKEVIKEITTEYIPQLLARYQGVRFELEGANLEERRLTKRVGLFFAVSLFLIYGLLAIPLHSYLQPIIIMLVIPFGFIGALAGHILFGYNMSMFSLFGLVALAGVVVNDSLILVDFINKMREQSISVHNSTIQAGMQRFRAIFLTTATTFFGLLPIMFEPSLQAQIVVPMALSLGFGILFGTVITLFMIPALYGILEDLHLVFGSRISAPL